MKSDFKTPWKSAPRRWGNPLHAMASYMAMFPPAIPHTFIRLLTEPGDVVYDPFSGRGTTPLEACLEGRIGLGSDANPLAWLLTAAKTDLPTSAGVSARLKQLRATAGSLPATEVPDNISMLFSQATLEALLWLREELDPSRRVDRFLMAVLLGGLHLNARVDGTPRGLTVAMPNTFAMSPNYVRRFIESRGLKAPEADPIEFLSRRAERYPIDGSRYRRGKAWMQDVRRPIRWPKGVPTAKLIFSSPPYLEVMRYGKYNWVRLWFLRRDPALVDASLVSTSSLPRYRDFMGESVANFRRVLRDDGYLCLVLGDVRRSASSESLADVVAQDVMGSTDLRLDSVIVDDLPEGHKVSRIWKGNPGRATKTDRIVVLAAPGARRFRLSQLARLSLDWSR